MDASSGLVRVPGPLTLLRRRHGLVRSALRRGTDRVEAAVSVLAVLIALLVVPIVLTVASESYQHGRSDAATAAAERTQVSATLLENPVPQSSSAGDGVPPAATATARWQLPDGRQRTGRLPVAADQRAGDVQPIWVGRAGDRVLAPRSPGDVLASAIVVGVDLVILGWLLIALVWWLVCRVLAQVNDVRWDLEWARTGGAPDPPRRNGAGDAGT